MGERYIGKGWRAYRGIWRGRGQARGPKAGRPAKRETNLETSGENSLFTQINIKYILYIVYLKELISLFVRFWREFWKWVLGGGGPAWRLGPLVGKICLRGCIHPFGLVCPGQVYKNRQTVYI